MTTSYAHTRGPAAILLRIGLLLVTAISAASVSAASWYEPAEGWPAAGDAKGVVDLTAELGQQDARYLYNLPKDYSSEHAWPVALVLHGGPGGKASAMQHVFAGPLVERGVIGIFPQALKKQLLEWNYPHSSAYLVYILQDVAKRWRIDPKRIYLLGHSMGGGGTWAQGAVLKDLWAGLGPLSGWAVPTPAPDFRGLAGIPLYNIHGDADRAVPAQISDLGFEKLAAARARTFVFTERAAIEDAGKATHLYHKLPGVGHNVFDPRKVRGPDLAQQLDWLLQHERPRPADLRKAGAGVVAWGRQFGWQPVQGQALGGYAGE